MNGCVDIQTIQANIEWYIKKNYYGRIHAMNWESGNNGSLRLLLYIREDPSLLVFTKKELQGYIRKGWERRIRKKLRNVVQDNKERVFLSRIYQRSPR